MAYNVDSIEIPTHTLDVRCKHRFNNIRILIENFPTFWTINQNQIILVPQIYKLNISDLDTSIALASNVYLLF